MTTTPSFGRRLVLAALAILVERLWPAIAPAIGVAALFLVISLFDLWSLAPGWPHVAGLILFATLFAIALARGLWRFRVPSREEARRRIELSSGLVHRPLAQLEDRPAINTDDPASLALWQAHRARLLAALKGIRVGMPRAGLAARDPWAFRGVLGLLLVLGLIVANDDTAERLRIALTPDFTGTGRQAPSIDAWISPPAYTSLPPIFLTRESGPVDTTAAPVKVPVGSALAIRVHGGRSQPRLVEDGGATPFETVDRQNFQLSKAINAGEHLTVEQSGSPLASWRIAIVPDQPPQIAFVEPPSETQRKALKLHYKASDDYGLAKVGVEIRREGGTETLSLPLPLPGLNPKSASETAYHDLTAHPWAGLKVTITLTAEDATGQKGSSAPETMVLPAREFHHPVARALVELRRWLATAERPQSVIGMALGAISSFPATFGDDAVVYLSLVTAKARLGESNVPANVSGVVDLLWDTALRLEDGGLSLAERELRQAQRDLMDALGRNAPDDEIQRLMERLQQALDNFLQALAEDAKRQTQDEMSELPPDAQMLSREDLQRMMDRAREMARSGQRDAARDMLSRLENLLENLHAGRPSRQPGQRQAEQTMRGLNDLLHRQQQLLDKTFRRSQSGQQSGQQSQQGRQGRQPQRGGQPGQSGEGEEDMQGMSGEQEALRGQLDELMRQLGEAGREIPGALGRAERSMRDARDALNQGSAGRAVQPETEALDQLRQGLQGMMQQYANQQGQNGQNQQRQGRAGAEKEDPLGRPLPGDWDDGDSTKVPDQADTQRSREILEELYRRSGERQRPEPERQYLDRLLKRF
ncbi:MAG TPA: TIGR02302 family protein [Candidatus Cybelea sp.]|nr:TIGR02302 family protein [Candidatus Cybelea sp.]